VIVRYKCGCVALRLTQTFDRFAESASIYVVQPCDEDGDSRSPVLCRRDGLHTRGFTVLPISEAESIVERLGGLVLDGHRAREAKALLDRIGH
jgi:hypothetical protein